MKSILLCFLYGIDGELICYKVGSKVKFNKYFRTIALGKPELNKFTQPFCICYFKHKIQRSTAFLVMKSILSRFLFGIVYLFTLICCNIGSKVLSDKYFQEAITPRNTRKRLSNISVFVIFET